MTAIKFCRRAVHFDPNHWINQQAKCSKKTAAEVISSFCGVSTTTARQLVEESMEVVGTGSTTFSGLGQYGGFSWSTRVSVGFDFVDSKDVIALIEKLQAMHPQPPVDWNLRYAK